MILLIPENVFNGTRTADGKTCIGDTSLSKYMPEYLKPMININKIKCGCKTYISAMSLQSDINIWRISELVKVDKLYIVYASTLLLQISNSDIIQYMNDTFPKISHIHLRACDDVSSYRCPSPITASNIQNRNWILNCCSDCTRMNAPYLESSEQLDCLFPTSLHKIKLHIFQNIPKISIHGLRQFKYNNTCKLCDNICDKHNIYSKQ